MSNQARLISNQNTIILPEFIDHDTYAMVATTLLVLEGQPVHFYCAGGGGSIDATLSIVDMILAHQGLVSGWLPGIAKSAHGLIWLACSKRYIYPNSALGIHKVSITALNDRADSTSLALMIKEWESFENVLCCRLAELSNMSYGYWSDLVHDAGSGAMHILKSVRLKELGIGEEGSWTTTA